MAVRLRLWRHDPLADIPPDQGGEGPHVLCGSEVDEAWPSRFAVQATQDGVRNLHLLEGDAQTMLPSERQGVSELRR